MAAMLLERHAATVTIAGFADADLGGEVARADIVVAAIGKAELVKGASMTGRLVVDVGMNRLEDGRLVGDVEYAEAAKRASAITPSPGGVGPMTRAMLLVNTLELRAPRRALTHPTPGSAGAPEVARRMRGPGAENCAGPSTTPTSPPCPSARPSTKSTSRRRQAGRVRRLGDAGAVRRHHRGAPAVREAAGLFDVSHMGEVVLRGPRRARSLPGLITNDVAKLRRGQALYTLLCRETAASSTTCIVYQRADDDLLVCQRRQRREGLSTGSRAHAGRRATSTTFRRAALIAVQGPRLAAPVRRAADDRRPLAAARASTVRDGEVAGVRRASSRAPATPARTASSSSAAPRTRRGSGTRSSRRARPLGVPPAGLGARDTLRLEAKLPLYGNDIDDDHTRSRRASAGWSSSTRATSSAARRSRASRRAGLARKLVGFEMTERGMPRHGYPILHGRRARSASCTSGTRARPSGSPSASATCRPALSGRRAPSSPSTIRGRAAPRAWSRRRST